MSLRYTVARLFALPPLLAAATLVLTDALFWPALIYASVSLLTLCAYGWDKRQAVHLRRRLPEKWLHTLELLGGWPGALIGQQVLRHKSSKASYQLAFWSIVLLHWLIWAAYLGWRWQTLPG